MILKSLNTNVHKSLVSLFVLFFGFQSMFAHQVPATVVATEPSSQVEVGEKAGHGIDSASMAHQAHSSEAKHEEFEQEEHSISNMIMHHIADANEFHIWGDLTMPLPVMIYNQDKKQFFTTSSAAFHSHHGEGTVEVDGYEMTHSRVHPVDGSKYIDFSITKNVFVMLLGLILLFILFFRLKSVYKKREGKAPNFFQGLFEPILEFITKDIAQDNIGYKYKKFVPYLVCTFFFILINNLLGLLPLFPGSANVSGNISFTFVMALIAFLVINFNGTKDYFKHIFLMPGVPKPVLLILTPIEFIGMFIKPIALMLRLFGNISGGHIAIMSIASMVFILGEMGKNVGGSVAGGAIAIPLLIFVNAMELFVAFLQAYVFTLLTAIFIGQAVEEHEHH